MTDLYKEELMDIYRNPHNKGSIKDPTISVDEKNPFCGDEIKLYLKVKDDLVEDAKYEGSACSVSIISSSLITDFVKGKKLSELKKLDKEKVLEIINLNLSTSRVACATLVLAALRKALNEYETNKTDK